MAETKLTGFSTYGESSKPIEQVAPTVEPIIEASTTELSDTTVNDEGVIDTAPEVAAAPAEVAKPTEEVAADVVELDFPDFEAATTETTAAPQISNWKEAIKNVDRKELLKELGITDFAIEVSEHQSNGGDPADYFAAKAIDWSKVSDTDVIKDDLRLQFPDATPQQLERILNKKYSQTDLADDEEKEDGLLLLRSEARRLREQRVEHQSKFKIAAPIQVQQAQQQETNFEAEKQARLNFIQNTEAVKNLIQSKRVAIQLGENESFNFDLKTPDVIVRAMIDPTYARKFHSDDKGEPDVSKLIRIFKYAANPDAHDKAIFNYGKQKGHRVEVEKGMNAKRPLGKTAVPETETLGQAFATRARKSTYGTPA